MLAFCRHRQTARAVVCRAVPRVFVPRLFSSSSVALTMVSPHAPTHHVLVETGEPFYDARFEWVLSFHDPPGLAPVGTVHEGSYHIDKRGRPAYSARFERCFGFYEDIATVVVEPGIWSHIRPDGSLLRASSPAVDGPPAWAWAGNFQQGRCVVRAAATNGASYTYVDRDGGVVGAERFAYAGDFREGLAVVRHSTDGLCGFVDLDGSVMRELTAGLPALFELDVFHKGFARAKDERGWFFIDRSGVDVSAGRRFRSIEPFYNGMSYAVSLSGRRIIVDETGHERHQVGESEEERLAALQQIATSYWPAFALRHGVDSGLADVDGEVLTTEDSQLKRVLRAAWCEMGLMTQQDNQNNQNNIEHSNHNSSNHNQKINHKIELSPLGCLLRQGEIGRDRADYWLQDRYLEAWVPKSVEAFSKRRSSGDRDAFKELGRDAIALGLSHRVLASYAREDWNGLRLALPPSARTVVDIGGGSGVLLASVRNSIAADDSRQSMRFVCFDRPEVVDMLRRGDDAPAGIEFVGGDMFDDPLPAADVFILSRVLHDWNDNDCIRLLSRIRGRAATCTAGSSTPVLFVIDREANDANRHALLSLHMQLLLGSYERDRPEWDAVFRGAGWDVVSRRTFGDHVVAELSPSTSATDLAPVQSKTGTFSGIPRKAVVPVAGSALRFPQLESLNLPKALLPVPDDCAGVGVQSVLFRLLSQELFSDQSSIEEVCLVVSPRHADSFDNFIRWFDQTFPAWTGRLRTVVQAHPLGTGNALIQARDFIADEPFVLTWGDHVFMQPVPASRSCCVGLLQTYNALTTRVEGPISLTGLQWVTARDVPHTGIVRARRVGADDNVMLVTECAEKPSLARAMAEFAPSVQSKADVISADDGSRFLGYLGIDVLHPSVLHTLQEGGELVRNAANHEVCLRSAMDVHMRDGMMYGSVLDDCFSIDIGTPDRYIAAFDEVRRSCVKTPSTTGSLARSTRTGNDDGVALVRDAMASFGDAVVSHGDHESGATAWYGCSTGRLDLMGGVADYSGSTVLQLPVEERCHAVVCRTSRPTLDIFSLLPPDISDESSSQRELRASIPMELLFHDRKDFCDEATLRQRLDEVYQQEPNGPHRWLHYIVGSLVAVLRRATVHANADDSTSGFQIWVSSEVPLNQGMASSAAVEVAIARAAMRALAVDMSSTDVALMCQRVENAIVGAPCGFMDQICSVYGEAGLAVAFECKVERLEPEQVPLPAHISVRGVNSYVKHSVAGAAYTRARVATFMGKRMLGLAPHEYLCDVAPSRLLERLDDLPQSVLGSEYVLHHGDDGHGDGDVTRVDSAVEYPVRAATMHAVFENERVRQFLAIIKLGAAGDDSMRVLAELMFQSHASYSACGLGSAETDELVSKLRRASLASGIPIGARVTGGGCGGIVAVLHPATRTATEVVDQAIVQ